MVDQSYSVRMIGLISRQRCSKLFQNVLVCVALVVAPVDTWHGVLWALLLETIVLFLLVVFLKGSISV